MDKLKESVKRNEAESKAEFENFAQTNKDNPFMSNLQIMRMRAFHYKELLKLYALNYRQDYFAATRNSMFAFMVAPAATALAFNIMSPFSILRSIAVLGAFGGSFGSFIFNLKDDLQELAMRDKTDLGD